MASFFNGILDFGDGDCITIQRLAKHDDIAALDCKLTWAGSIWIFQCSGRRLEKSSETYLFEGPTFDISKGKPDVKTRSEVKLVLTLHMDDEELDATGTWTEEGEDYSVSGVLEPMPQPQ